jgi:hypothetical protein
VEFGHGGVCGGKGVVCGGEGVLGCGAERGQNGERLGAHVRRKGEGGDCTPLSGGWASPAGAGGLLGADSIVQPAARRGGIV